MYPVSYHSFGLNGKEIRVNHDALNSPNMPDYKVVCVSASPKETGDETSIIINLAGEPSQLRHIAQRILELVPEEIELSQPTADDEAARDFELLQEARKNTPEVNMEQPELEGKSNAA